MWRWRCWMRRRRRWLRLLCRDLRRQRGQLWRCRRWCSTKRPCSIGRRFRHPAWLELQHQRLGYEPLRRWRGWRRIWCIILLWCSRAHNGCRRRVFLQGLGRSRVRQVGCESRRRALTLRVEPDAGFFWCRPWPSIRRRPRRLWRRRMCRQRLWLWWRRLWRWGQHGGLCGASRRSGGRSRWRHLPGEQLWQWQWWLRRWRWLWGLGRRASRGETQFTLRPGPSSRQVP
mmetsp:Transcript_69194/g.175863  ORF Transcript_69194/g.175863 Transcript_69194/m.175863 type:complete len:229 (-) Transcript_69194:511-1197(-)